MSLGLAIFILGILAMMIWNPGFRRLAIAGAVLFAVWIAFMTWMGA